jgi:hypothetical protein
MRKTEPAWKVAWAILLAVLFIPIIVFWFLTPARTQKSVIGLPTGRNIILSGVADRKVDELLLKTLLWEDVIATAEGVWANKELRKEVAALAGKTRHPPALYLRGLLLMATDDLPAALASFLLIPAAELPLTHVYAPYRLQNALRPAQPNPFLAAMNRAISENRVPPLIQGRVLASEGRFEEAIKAYLATDPAGWLDLDMRALRTLRMHAGLGGHTSAMLMAALKAGRVPTPLRAEVVGILKAPQDQMAGEDLRTQLLRQIKTNPGVREAAISGAGHQLDLRQKFVSRKYREVLDPHASANPVLLPEETVLMLVLSSAQVRDVSSLDLWSQELKRRNPTPETVTWLNQIRRSAK